MKYWYKGRIAKHVYGDVFYVWRGEWSDPCYVLKESSESSFLGTTIHGKEVNYYDIWNMYEEGEEPTPQDIATDVVEYLNERYFLSML